MSSLNRPPVGVFKKQGLKVSLRWLHIDACRVSSLLRCRRPHLTGVQYYRTVINSRLIAFEYGFNKKYQIKSDNHQYNLIFEVVKGKDCINIPWTFTVNELGSH
ncbi:UNVERIFIED_CONTAM: hypothetical protein NCL1_15381 [Trichonephila clavipes]